MDERLKRGLNWLSMMVTMAHYLAFWVLLLAIRLHLVGSDIVLLLLLQAAYPALVATATGLSVAIVALAIHSWCTDKVIQISQLEQN